MDPTNCLWIFSKVHLTKRIAEEKELPKWFDHTNDKKMPDRSIILWGMRSGLFAIIGSLSSLEAAVSLVFLFTFGVVNWLCLRESDNKKWIPELGLTVVVITACTLPLGWQFPNRSLLGL